MITTSHKVYASTDTTGKDASESGATKDANLVGTTDNVKIEDDTLTKTNHDVSSEDGVTTTKRIEADEANTYTNT